MMVLICFGFDCILHGPDDILFIPIVCEPGIWMLV
jgi:hypothetical protein